MQVRFSMVRGTPIVDDQSDSVVGTIDSLLIDPDTGVVLGFFVHRPTFLSSALFYLSSTDIVSWGKHVHIRDEHRLSDPSDIVRLQSLLSSPRRVLHQRVVTQPSLRSLGICRDVQFDTRQFVVTWLFPFRWHFFAGVPIPVDAIVEVTQRHILVRTLNEAARNMSDVKKKNVDISLAEGVTARCKL